MDDRTGRFRQLLVRGTRLLQAGKSGEALPHLREAYEVDPDSLDAALNLGGAYILQKKFRKAVPILESLSEQHPKNEMVWINLGAAYLGNPVLATSEQQMRAIEAFRRALEINPAAHSVAYNIGLIYRDRRELGKAVDWFGQAVQNNPGDKDARRLLARMQARLEEE